MTIIIIIIVIYRQFKTLVIKPGFQNTLGSATHRTTKNN